MSNGINRVVLFGNLGADPELRVTQGGQMVLKLRIATSDAYYDKEKHLVERTEWHSVTIFGNRAEALARILSKGDRLLVEGTIRYSSYEKDGTTRYRTEIVGREVCLGGGRRAVITPTVSHTADALDMMEDPFATEPAVATDGAADKKGGRNGAAKPEATA